MREIKFNAIYKPTGEHFVPHKINFEGTTVYGSFDGDNDNWCHFSLDGKRGDVILRQYVGTNDKNDNPIYEGDLVKLTHATGYGGKSTKYKDFICEVVFDEFSLSFTAKYPKDVGKYRFRNSGLKRSIVIGNKFEHQHLLEEDTL